MAENEKPIFSSSEADRMIQLLQIVYSLDDAISNQMKLQRPPAFVTPLQNIREAYNKDLADLASKGKTKTEN